MSGVSPFIPSLTNKFGRPLSSVTDDTVPYFFVNGGQDFRDLLLQASIGLRKYFLCPCTPFDQQGILCTTVRKGDNGIDTLYSHQYSVVDKRVAEEIKVKPFPITVSINTFINSSTVGFFIILSSRVGWTCFTTLGLVTSPSISITSPSSSLCVMLLFRSELATWSLVFY
jgi:hypothetical protein